MFKVFRRYCRNHWSDARKIIENKCTIKLHKVLAQAKSPSARSSLLNELIKLLYPNCCSRR